MDALLPVMMILVASAATGWFYWQTQKTEARITATAARLAEQAALVGEMVDEVCAASQQLYAEMDRWQMLVDSAILHGPRTEPVAPVDESDADSVETAAALQELVEQKDPQPEPQQEPEPDQEPESLDYSPHLHALKLALDGVPQVEIARRTGIGTEELRLLLRFQEEINSPA